MTIEKLLILGTELDNLELQQKMTIDTNKVTCRTMTAKIESITRVHKNPKNSKHLI
jgi:hypothetical protein